MPADLSGLPGAPVDRVVEQLGAPDADEGISGERWLVYRLDAGTLRIRCERPRRERPDPDAPLRVSSWVLTLEEGSPTLREATEPWGLWPLVAPDVAAAEVGEPMARRAVPAPDDGSEHSFTAGIRDGGFARLAVFDEPPDWL